MDKAKNNVLETMFNTPLIRLNRIPERENIKCQLFAKCEYFNPGGSIKDRIGYNMVLAAKDEGLIKAGDYVIESTSGNTGIGVALACVIFEMKCIITITDKMSQEKINILKGLGCEIHVCDNSLPAKDPNR